MDKQEEHIEKTYLAIRQKQVKQWQRESGQPETGLTNFDLNISKAISTAAAKAVKEVREDRRDVSFNVVTAPTGAGKTSNSIAYAIARRQIDKSFTAAFVVKTILQCDEIYKELVGLSSKDMVSDIVVWSSGHDIKKDSEKIYEDYGLSGQIRFNSEDLKSAPIVIVTHNKWLYEVDKNIDNGIRECDGKARDLVFIDENPDIVSLIEKTPSDIAKLKDLVIQEDSEHSWVSLLKDIQGRMESVFDTEGASYISARLVKPREVECLTDSSFQHLFNNCSTFIHPSIYQDLKQTLEFLKACADGYVFFTRQKPRSFVAYVTNFKPLPGYVLLDATADLSGLVSLMSGMDEVSVPEVNYENLKIRQIEPPKEFKSPKTITSSISNSKPYITWIEKLVLLATQPDDDVLIVVHKKLIYDYELLPIQQPKDSLDWGGRRVKVLHWGAGVGSNRYKDCRHVFLFGEFFRPRRVTAGQTLGLGKLKAEDANLKQLQGQTVSGHFLTMYEGDLLRWSKQLACRGNARNIDAEGRCGEMTLHTTMDLTRLIENVDRLFPGAAIPEVVLTESQSDNNALIELLASPSTPAIISFAEFSSRSGIASNRIPSKLKAKKASSVIAAYGWRFATARELGLSGRSKYLTKKPAA